MAHAGQVFISPPSQRQFIEQLELLRCRCVCPRQALPVHKTLVTGRCCRLFFKIMRTLVNLSSRPFTNHRIFWIVLFVIYLNGLWLFLWMAAEKNRVIARADNVKQRIEGQRKLADEAKAEQERRKKEAQKIVITEQQTTELAAARHLIQRKVFSWNKMIADIEEYVPKNTRIMSIKVDEIINTSEDAM